MNSNISTPARCVWPWCLVLALLGPVGPISHPAEPASETTNATSKATNALPPAGSIIARFVKEIGGKAAVQNIQSQHIQGKFDLGAQGITGKLEVFAKRPDKLLIKITLPAVGEMLQGYDGKVGWSVTPMTGPMVLEGKMLQQSKEQARFDAVLHEASEYKSLQTLGKEEFEDKDCYKVKLVRKSGQEVTEFYDTQTGLLAGSTESQETPLGVIAVTSLTSDYRRFGEVLFATRLVQKMGPLAQVMTFETMEFDNVEDSVFELPDAVKALTKK